LRELEEAWVGQDPALATTDAQFHLALAAASHNTLMLAVAPIKYRPGAIDEGESCLSHSEEVSGRIGSSTAQSLIMSRQKLNWP